MHPRNSDEAILDAARRIVLDRGPSRTTLSEVARSAGLSRMTVYRRWQGLPELMGAMMQREWETLLAPRRAALPDRLAAADNVRELFVDELVAVVALLRNSELLTGIRTVEPEMLLPYLVERPGRVHGVAEDFAMLGIVQGQADGSIRAGDPHVMATTLVMAAQSWTVSLTAAGAGHDPATLDAELAELFDRYLRP